MKAVLLVLLLFFAGYSWAVSVGEAMGWASISKDGATIYRNPSGDVIGSPDSYIFFGDTNIGPWGNGRLGGGGTGEAVIVAIGGNPEDVLYDIGAVAFDSLEYNTAYWLGSEGFIYSNTVGPAWYPTNAIVVYPSTNGEWQAVISQGVSGVEGQLINLTITVSNNLGVGGGLAQLLQTMVMQMGGTTNDYDGMTNAYPVTLAGEMRRVADEAKKTSVIISNAHNDWVARGMLKPSSVGEGKTIAEASDDYVKNQLQYGLGSPQGHFADHLGPSLDYGIWEITEQQRTDFIKSDRRDGALDLIHQDLINGLSVSVNGDVTAVITNGSFDVRISDNPLTNVPTSEPDVVVLTNWDITPYVPSDMITLDLTDREAWQAVTENETNNKVVPSTYAPSNSAGARSSLSSYLPEDFTLGKTSNAVLVANYNVFGFSSAGFAPAVFGLTLTGRGEWGVLRICMAVLSHLACFTGLMAMCIYAVR